MSVLAMRVLTPEDRDEFARQSGDLNSVHFGEAAIAHGVHIVSWAIATIVKDGDIIVSLEVQFRNPVPVGAELELRLLMEDSSYTMLGVYVGGLQAVLIKVKRRQR